jgi:DegV family protein with EDD domain
VTTTALVTDSTSYLPPGLAAELGVTVVPLHVTLAGQSFDEPDLPAAEFYRRLRDSGQPPTTSQPSPGEFLQAFVGTGADRVLCLTCTASLSGTHASAVLAAGMSPVPVEVVDSGTISGGLCLVVAEVGRALADGMPYDDAVALARSLSQRVASTWTSDSTALLQAGGRFAADVPDGVPVLALEGTVRVLGSARSTEEAIDLQAQAIRAAAAASPTPVTVGHGDVPDLADALEQAVAGAPGVLGVDRYVVGPVVGAHAGAGNVGASYLR